MHQKRPFSHGLLDHLNDTPVVLEFIRDPMTERVGPRLKFATELTAIGMRRHQVADTSPGHFRRMFVLANLGFNHSVRVVHAAVRQLLIRTFHGVAQQAR